MALLLAQWLLLSHAPHDGHVHDTDEPVQACTLCLFKATGQDAAGPLPVQAATWLAVLALLLGVRAGSADARGQVPRSRRQARGPPAGARR